MTEIKQSLLPDAGYGVFVTRDFIRGEYVCFYDGYYKDNETTQLEDKYKLGDNFIGHSSVKHENGTAQLINDAAKLCFTEQDIKEMNNDDIVSSAIFTANLILRYIILSYDGRNVEMCDIDNHKYEATKDIRKGDELYWGYEVIYWVTQSDQYESIPILIINTIERFGSELSRKDSAFNDILRKLDGRPVRQAQYECVIYALKNHKHKNRFRKQFIELYNTYKNIE